MMIPDDDYCGDCEHFIHDEVGIRCRCHHHYGEPHCDHYSNLKTRSTVNVEYLLKDIKDLQECREAMQKSIYALEEKITELTNEMNEHIYRGSH